MHTLILILHVIFSVSLVASMFAPLFGSKRLTLIAQRVFATNTALVVGSGAVLAVVTQNIGRACVGALAVVLVSLVIRYTLIPALIRQH